MEEQRVAWFWSIITRINAKICRACYQDAIFKICRPGGHEDETMLVCGMHFFDYVRMRSVRSVRMRSDIVDLKHDPYISPDTDGCVFYDWWLIQATGRCSWCGIGQVNFAYQDDGKENRSIYLQCGKCFSHQVSFLDSRGLKIHWRHVNVVTDMRSLEKYIIIGGALRTVKNVLFEVKKKEKEKPRVVEL